MPGSKRHKGGKRSSRGTGRPSGKDRSDHEAARGKKIEPLSDLSRKALDHDEFMDALLEMHKESDRGAAIMGAALLEEGLENLLRAAMANPDDKAGLFDDKGAPFGTMHAKTLSAYAFGLIGEPLTKDIEIVRSVRNQFSHALRPITFRTPSVSHTCLPLEKYVPAHLLKFPEHDPGKARFVFEAACLDIWKELASATTAEYEKFITKYRPPNALLGAADLIASIDSYADEGGSDVDAD